jgi:hypothetical protein
MGNIFKVEQNHNTSINYTDSFRYLTNDEITKIRNENKVVDVDWLDKDLADFAMFKDDYFRQNPAKKNVVQNMLDYYLSHKDKPIYKKTDYLCNKKEAICICNTHAEDLRKIYEGINYKQGVKFVSWIRKANERF